MAVSAVNALACVPRRGSDRIGSGRVRGGTGQCRFPPASFDISVETETGGGAWPPGGKGGDDQPRDTEARSMGVRGEGPESGRRLEKSWAQQMEEGMPGWSDPC